jgi:hypothetical protein
MTTPHWGLMVLAVALFLSGCQRKLEWKEFTSTEGNFTVLMPGTPKTETRNAPSAAGVLAANICAAETKDGAFFVMYSNIPAHAPFDADVGLQAVASSYQGKVLNKCDATLGNIKCKACEIETQKPKGYASLRVFVRDNKLYTLQVLGADMRESSPDVQKFFESFKMTK